MLMINFKRRKQQKSIQKSRLKYGFLKPDKKQEKNAPNEKSRDFCRMFMNSMEDGRRNPGSRPWFLKLGKIQGLDPRLLTTVNTNSGRK
jgi:hypothetical protein